VHPVGGFCAASSTLPLPQNIATEVDLAGVDGNGLNTPLHQTVHCIAAEPHATFLRLGIADGGQEVAYETAVLGRLSCGYRIFQMRSVFGTRIELCTLLVGISVSSEPNVFATQRQLRIQSSMLEVQRLRMLESIEQKVIEEKVAPRLDEIARLRQEIADLRQSQVSVSTPHSGALSRVESAEYATCKLQP